MLFAAIALAIFLLALSGAWKWARLMRNPRRPCPHDSNYSYRLDMSVGKDGKIKYRERFVPIRPP